MREKHRRGATVKGNILFCAAPEGRREQTTRAMTVRFFSFCRGQRETSTTRLRPCASWFLLLSPCPRRPPHLSPGLERSQGHGRTGRDGGQTNMMPESGSGNIRSLAAVLPHEDEPHGCEILERGTKGRTVRAVASPLHSF